ncbi:MAG TPA: aminotransferase class I/II-fold pyridoxal phosphate-dependent enzyme [Pseudonocardiaceae bacterium]|jgi:aspartate/methionine/tyrosine aminotransferase
MVSQRAALLAAQSPAIATAHFRAQADPYHPEHNPGGYLNLGTAENRLVWDLLAPRLTATRPVRAEDTHYGPLHGTPALRTAIAAFLGRCWRAEVDPDDLVVVSGATGALDVIASVLCDPGEAIIVPAPYYSALDVDLAGRSGARLIRVPLDGATGFRLDPAMIDRALSRARADGVTVRAVAVTSPDNPVGHVHPGRVLRELREVARRHDVDLIVDEIYANSVFGPDPFVGALDPVLGTEHAERVHVVWGFAKDFGLSGLKVGVLHTSHPEVRAAARALAYFAPVSTDTQRLLRELLAGQGWVGRFLAEHRNRLRRSHQRAAGLLTRYGIPQIPAGAGFSIWADLRSWLPAATFDAEQALWRHIWDVTRVNILPGGSFGCPDPGWFRICHTTDPAVVRDGINRLGEELGRLATPDPVRVKPGA